MKYGFVISAGEARDVAELATVAEGSGWDAVFSWETVWGQDPWVMLAAAAMTTERVRLGTLLTPLPRRKPWDLAAQTTTLDRLSGGRVQLCVGLGAVHEGWLAFETDQGRRTRAELLDEGLDVLFGLWSGKPFGYSGKHYTVQPSTAFAPPPPIQQPRIPVWCTGMAGSRRSLARAARCDGLLPNIPTPEGDPVGPTAQSLASVVEEVLALRAEAGLSGPYDVIAEGKTDPDDPAASRHTKEMADAGATWFIEGDWSLPPETAVADQRRRLEAGPPRH